MTETITGPLSKNAFVRLPITIPDDPSRPSDERDKWLAARKKGIGSADAAAACGLSRYKTELQLYLEKRGEIAEEDLSENRRVRMGSKLEQTVAEEYEADTGRKLQRMRSVLQSRQYPFMQASLDRVVIGERRLVELKTAGFWAMQKQSEWGPSGTDQTPIEYAIQVMHQLIVTRFDFADLVALFNNDELRIYPFTPNEKLITLIVERETEFWRRVQQGDPPAPRTLDDAQLAFPQAKEKPVYASPEIAATVGEIQHFQRQIKEITEQVDARKVAVQSFMGDGDTLYMTGGGDPIATWKNSSRTTLDAKQLRLDFKPEELEPYTRTTEFRLFKIRGEE